MDQRTDIYSLGIAAYELFTGKHPFPEADLPKVMQAHLIRDLPDPASENNALPGELSRILCKACRKDPAQRHQDMGELRVELQALILRLKGAQEISGGGVLQSGQEMIRDMGRLLACADSRGKL